MNHRKKKAVKVGPATLRVSSREIKGSRQSRKRAERTFQVEMQRKRHRAGTAGSWTSQGGSRGIKDKPWQATRRAFSFASSGWTIHPDVAETQRPCTCAIYATHEASNQSEEQPDGTKMGAPTDAVATYCAAAAGSDGGARRPDGCRAASHCPHYR